eukprot:Amastigsp_a184494_28.p3 type:complete len:156 gc:universal Amastigsp_a184494_28:114-581(+)
MRAAAFDEATEAETDIERCLSCGLGSSATVAIPPSGLSAKSGVRGGFLSESSDIKATPRPMHSSHCSRSRLFFARQIVSFASSERMRNAFSSFGSPTQGSTTERSSRMTAVGTPLLDLYASQKLSFMMMLRSTQPLPFVSSRVPRMFGRRSASAS